MKQRNHGNHDHALQLMREDLEAPRRDVAIIPAEQTAEARRRTLKANSRPLKPGPWTVDGGRLHETGLTRGTRAVNLTVPVKPYIDDEYPPMMVYNGRALTPKDWAKEMG